jgi:phosphoglycerate dehydrogenase-like enzyme
MSRPLVLVTETEFRRAEPVFASTVAISPQVAPPNERRLADAIRTSGARHVIVGGTRYEHELYASLPKGGVIARFGVGHDGIDKAKATAAGVLCTNTPGVLDQSTAELAIALMTAAARQLTMVDADLRRGTWALRVGIELRGKTLAIIGAGRIGRAVARIASAGYGMHVVGCRRSPTSSKDAADSDFATIATDYAAAVRDADFVSLHMPADPENAQFMNRDRLSMMRAKSWLINTARGAVVDERALYDVLIEGRLAGAALDVFAREPYEPIEPGRDLRTLPNVILTPHIGSHTPDANRGMAERAIHNIVLAERGDFVAMDLLNPEVLRT